MNKKQNTNQLSIWSAFTKKYALSKTLRFELKPIAETVEWLEKNNIFKKDLNIDKSYNQAKFYFDKLHQEFIEEALADSKERNLGFEEFAQKFNQTSKQITDLKKQKNVVSDKKEQNEIQEKINNLNNGISKLRTELYENIGKLFDEKAEEWKKSYEDKEIEEENGNKKKIKFSKSDLDQKGAQFLMSAGIIQVLKFEFPRSRNNEFINREENGEKWPSLFIQDETDPNKQIYIFDSFDRFTTYLGRFQKTRENLYKTDGTSTAVVTRIVSNLERFLKNTTTFEEKYKKHQGLNFSSEEKQIFNTDYYYDCLIQKGIDDYNKKIGEINKKAKEYRDKNKIDKKDLPLFITLEKQILGAVKKQRKLIEARENKKEEDVFIEVFQNFVRENEGRIAKAKQLMKSFVNGEFENDYSNIYLKNNTVNKIAHEWLNSSLDFIKALVGEKVGKKDFTEEGLYKKVSKYVSLEDIKNAINQLEGDIFKEKFYKDKDNQDRPLMRIEEDDFRDNWEKLLKVWEYEFDQSFKEAKEGTKNQMFLSYTAELTEKAKTINSYDKSDKEQTKVIKNYCDAVLRINRLMRYFNLGSADVKDFPIDLSAEFYNKLDEYFRDFEFQKYYDEIRNFVTKKPSNEEKIKLNFENPYLLGGFSKQYGAYIFKNKKDNKYYLGVLPKGKPINEDATIQTESDYLYFPAKQLKFTNIINKAFETRFGYRYSEQKDEKKAIEDAKIFIKERHSKKYPAFSRILNMEFDSKKDFKNKVEEVCREIYTQNTFLPLDKSQVEGKLADRSLYIFEIKTKDLYKAKGRKNIHSFYFLSLFAPHTIIKISGNNEIFCRDEYKNYEYNDIITKERNKNITHFLREKFGIEKLRYGRYGERKYFLHLSIKIKGLVQMFDLSYA